LSNSSKVAPKIDPIHSRNDQWKRLHNPLPVIDFGTDRIFFKPRFWSIWRAIIFPTLLLWALVRPFHSFDWPQIKLWTPKCFT
jgi:hypothetical protein